MKLFRTFSTDIIKQCCTYFKFKLPIELIPGKTVMKMWVFTHMSLTRTVCHTDYVIVRPLSTVGYTSVASVSTVDSGLTNLIHDRCEL